MTHEKFEGERTLMRIHIGESDKWHGKPLHEAIVEELRREKFSGVTVLRGGRGLWVFQRLSHGQTLAPVARSADHSGSNRVPGTHRSNPAAPGSNGGRRPDHAGKSPRHSVSACFKIIHPRFIG